MATPSSYFSRSASTLSFSSFTLAIASASCACFFESVFMAACSLARLGATSLAILPYTSIARTHMQSDLHALEMAPTISGSKSASFVYLFTLVRTASLSASLS